MIRHLSSYSIEMLMILERALKTMGYYNRKRSHKKKKPNILFLMVDQERFPTIYETKELQEWRKENLVAQELLRKYGMEFLNHYVGSTACAPSRATLYTGQYPSLHGVTQTPGAAKDHLTQMYFGLIQTQYQQWEITFELQDIIPFGRGNGMPQTKIS